MKKQLFLLFALVATISGTCFAQSREDVDLAVNKFQTLYNSKQPENIFNMLSDRSKALMPADKTTETMKQLYQQVGELKSYEFLKSEQAISYYKLNFENAPLTLVLALDKDKKLESFRFLPFEDPATAEKSNFKHKSREGDLYGSLSLPDSYKTAAGPVVLIIAGSGPTDRNGNQTGMKTNTYKLLADSLLKAGIASLRYDKRGVGESAEALKDENNIRFEDMVNDAAGIISQLKADKRFSGVIVLGHSEGSLIGMIAAAREKVNGYISVAGIGDRADKIIVRQLAAQSEELSLKAAFILDSLSKGNTVTNIDSALAPLFRPSVQPYIQSWLKYDPQEEIKKLLIPVLIVQGTTDIQVKTEEADKLKAAYPRATMKKIIGMNHVLRQAPEDREKNMATYTKPELPLSPALIPAITAFVKSAAH